MSLLVTEKAYEETVLFKNGTGEENSVDMGRAVEGQCPVWEFVGILVTTINVL